MKLLILSDIHANVSALTSVLDDVKIKYNIDRLVLLGDHINYGMRPNETIEIIRKMPFPIDINLWGNHEKAIMDGNHDRFSSERGKEFSRFTSKLLNNESKDYIKKEMCMYGFAERIYSEKQYLIIHGSLEDIFWKSIPHENPGKYYFKYDYVLSGHSHLPYYMEKYYRADNIDTRGQKRTVFINPGSVGQPRNHNPRACYAVIDTEAEWVHLNNVIYDVNAEQALYGNDVHEFYKNRLGKGI
jgi:predicted phosphodiesterase